MMLATDKWLAFEIAISFPLGEYTIGPAQLKVSEKFMNINFKFEINQFYYRDLKMYTYVI